MHDIIDCNSPTEISETHKFLMSFIAWLILIDLYLSVTYNNTCNKSKPKIYIGVVELRKTKIALSSSLTNQGSIPERCEIDDQALDGGCVVGGLGMLRIIGLLGRCWGNRLWPNGRLRESVAYKSADTSLFSTVSCVRRSRGLGEVTSWSPCIPPAV